MDTASTALAYAKNPGTAIEKPKKDIYALVELQKKAFARLFADEKQGDRFARIAITALKNNYKLAKCDQSSILAGLMLSAQLGLEPNSPLHEASLIPYGEKAQFQIEYRGLLKLAWNSGLLKQIEFGYICENDEYRYELGSEGTCLIHKPNMREERGAPFIYYAFAELTNGGKVFHVMSKIEVLAHAKKYSKTWNGEDFSGAKYNGKKGKPGAWDTSFDSMAVKTVLKILCDKKLPKRTTDEAAKLYKALNADEGILSPIGIGNIADTDFTEIPMEYADFDPETGEIKEPDTFLQTPA